MFHKKNPIPVGTMPKYSIDKICKWVNWVDKSLLKITKGKIKEKAPKSLLYINDWDTWQHEYKESEQLQIAISRYVFISRQQRIQC